MSCLAGSRSIVPVGLVAVLVGVLAVPAALGQEPLSQTPTSAREAREHLIPVTDPLVLQHCGSCHAADAQGNMTRISSIRTTPEGWEEAIKRMVRLNGLQISPEDARKVLKSLADTHGLAPEEAKPVQYFLERELVDEHIENDDVHHACASCHAIAKPLSWHRTPQDWDYLRNMHVAFFPSIDGSFRRGGPFNGPRHEQPNADGTMPKEPVDIALAWVKKSTPLITPEWSAWQAGQQAPKLAGVWLVSGELPGKGKFFGQTTIAAAPAADGTYTTRTSLTFVDGMTWSSSGTSIVYTGYAWRGRAASTEKEVGPDSPNHIREVMMLSKDEASMTGRWFWGTYQEFGMQVAMRRSTDTPAVLGTDISALKAGTSGNTVRIFGANLPSSLSPADVNFGPGVTVSKIVSSTPSLVTVVASVDPKAVPGTRLVGIRSAALPEAYAVYDHMDYLKVTPETPIAHLGSEPHAKGYMQFEATAFSNGPDGKPHTADDINLGTVPATWKTEEFVASFGDDDIDFVGKFDTKTSLFTPASDGPNPKRKSMRNNYGDVWAVADYTPPGATEPLVGRSYFVIAVPQYLQYDQPEVAE